MGPLSSTARPLFQKIGFCAYLFYGSFVKINFKTGLSYLDFSVNCKRKTHRFRVWELGRILEVTKFKLSHLVTNTTEPSRDGVVCSGLVGFLLFKDD